MVFGHKTILNISDICIDNFKIERVYVTKFLGVLIDDKLCWKEHIKLVCGKIARNMSILFKVRYKLDQVTMHKLYSTLIFPYLFYCIEVWGNANKTVIQTIVRMQKKVIRIICNLKRNEHTSKYFKLLNELKLDDLYKLKIAVLLFKAKNSLLPDNIQRLFKLDCNQKYHTRQKEDFRIKFTKSKRQAIMPSFQGVHIWNSLHTELKMCKTLHMFKRKLKDTIIDNYLD